MKHYRRKRLLKALTDLYLNNWKSSATYAEQCRVIRSLETVGSRMRATAETDRMMYNSARQLALF